MHCGTLGLGHTWSIELVATMRNSYNILQTTQVPLPGGHQFYPTLMYIMIMCKLANVSLACGVQ